jgi:hypothetical protein
MPLSHQTAGKTHQAYRCFDIDGCYVLVSSILPGTIMDKHKDTMGHIRSL